MEMCRHLGGCQDWTLFRKVNTRVEDISLNCKLSGFGGSSWTCRSGGPAGSAGHVVAEEDSGLRTPGVCRHLATKLSCLFCWLGPDLAQKPPAVMYVVTGQACEGGRSSEYFSGPIYLGCIFFKGTILITLTE